MKKEKINPPVFRCYYRYCVCYLQNQKVILTYEDGGYYLGGKRPDIEPLSITQLDDGEAQWVLKVVEALQSNKEKYEKSKK